MKWLRIAAFLIIAGGGYVLLGSASVLAEGPQCADICTEDNGQVCWVGNCLTTCADLGQSGCGGGICYPDWQVVDVTTIGRWAVDDPFEDVCVMWQADNVTYRDMNDCNQDGNADDQVGCYQDATQDTAQRGTCCVYWYCGGQTC
jgi:hypothetical protein